MAGGDGTYNLQTLMFLAIIPCQVKAVKKQAKIA